MHGFPNGRVPGSRINRALREHNEIGNAIAISQAKEAEAERMKAVKEAQVGMQVLTLAPPADSGQVCLIRLKSDGPRDPNKVTTLWAQAYKLHVSGALILPQGCWTRGLLQDSTVGDIVGAMPQDFIQLAADQVESVAFVAAESWMTLTPERVIALQRYLLEHPEMRDADKRDAAIEAILEAENAQPSTTSESASTAES